MDFSVILQTQQFRALVQENALDRFFADGLYPAQLFRAEADNERWEANVGDNKTFTGKGLMKPRLRPLQPGQDPLPHDYKLEQWGAQQQKYADSIDTHLPTAVAAAVNKLTEDLKTLGLNAGQVLNRICRNKLYNAAESGWTVADGAQAAVTTLRVKRLNGFTRARRPDLAAGSAVRYDFVTANNPLPITVVQTAGGATATNVINYTPDTPGDEIGPGTLTLDVAVTVADRDAVFASSRTYIVRSGGGNAVDALSAGNDILHLSDIRSAVARLRSVDVPAMGDGTYHMHLDPTGEGQLYADNEFQRLNISLPDGIAYRDFAITRILGCTVYRNNECPQVSNVDGASTATFSQDDWFAGEMYANGVTAGAKVHRAVVVGESALKEYYVDQNAMITEAGVAGRVETGARVVNNGVEIDVERIHVIMRQPQDRLQEIVAQTWKFQGDFVTRTDGATGDAAAYKRECAIQFTE
jgi:hypothetical protein